MTAAELQALQVDALRLHFETGMVATVVRDLEVARLVIVAGSTEAVEDLERSYAADVVARKGNALLTRKGDRGVSLLTASIQR